jgi:hypothetical protein
VKALFTGEPLSWQGVYYYFNAKGKQGAWKKLWLASLRLHRHALDLSSIQFDGSHTLAKNGGAATGYQGRKAGQTTNALFLATTKACHWPWLRPSPATSTTRSSWSGSLPSCAACSKPPSYAWTAFF